MLPEVNIHECTAAADFCGNFVTVSLRATAASSHHPTLFSFLHQVLDLINLKSSRISLGIIFPGSEETQTPLLEPDEIPSRVGYRSRNSSGLLSVRERGNGLATGHLSRYSSTELIRLACGKHFLGWHCHPFQLLEGASRRQMPSSPCWSGTCRLSASPRW